MNVWLTAVLMLIFQENLCIHFSYVFMLLCIFMSNVLELNFHVELKY
jgi:hypothetical protein